MKSTLGLVSTCLILLTGLSATWADDAALSVREVGSFYVGGREASLSGLPPREIVTSPGMAPFKFDPNGEFEVDQMYVHFVKLAKPASPYPILFWHGGGMTGVTWETKPDGAPGWEQFFLGKGYDTYVSDAVERGRASWAQYPDIYTTPPVFRTKKDAWELFRFGPAGSYSSDRAKRAPFANVRFPVADFDTFMKQSVPRWLTNDKPTEAAYSALVDKVCPCIIVVHSQGSYFGFQAALYAPDKVKALIVVEPSSAPDPSKVDVTKLKSVPHMILYGDNLDQSPNWQRFITVPKRYADAMSAAGVPVNWVDLPASGIRGNTHFIMMDRNSDQVAGIVADWLSKSVK